MEMNDTTGFFNTTVPTPLFVSNKKEMFINIPAAVFIVILLVIGIIGNSTVLYVYIFKIKSNTFNIFITFLAACDLVTCYIMPLYVVNLLRAETFYMCKVEALLDTFGALTTGVILVAIAVVNYKCFCDPLRPNVSVGLAKRICFASLVIAGILSWPSVFLVTKRPRKLEPTVIVMNCILEEHFEDTLYPLLYHGFLFLLFIITFVTLAILYGIVGLHLRSRKKRESGLKPMHNATESTTKDVSITEGETYSCNGSSTRLKIQNFSPNSINGDLQSEPKEQMIMSDMGCNNMATALNQNILNQEPVKENTELASISKMLFIVTITFMATYLPYLTLTFIDLAGVDLGHNGLQESVVGICIRSYLISRVVNPIIYGCCNKMYRHEINEYLNSRRKEQRHIHTYSVLN